MHTHLPYPPSLPPRCSLRAFEHALVMRRLGPWNLLDKSHPSGHYCLDLGNPNHEQV